MLEKAVKEWKRKASRSETEWCVREGSEGWMGSGRVRWNGDVEETFGISYHTLTCIALVSFVLYIFFRTGLNA